VFTHGPLLALLLPLFDAADPPPVQTPPMPAGAMRSEIQTGYYIAHDFGWELEATLVGAGYLVGWPDESVTKRGTLWGRVANTWFVYKDSRMVADRYWLGPFARTELGTELMGRYKGEGIATLSRANFDVGYRFGFGAPGAGAIGFGYGLTHDRVDGAIDHGIRLQLDIGIR
jgi:hypothetical protein